MAILSETLRRYENCERIFTGEPNLDEALASVQTPARSSASQGSRGLPAPSFTEFSGPPGSGKTAICLSLAVETLKRGMPVLYVGCNHTLLPLRRASKLKDWNTERFEHRIDQIQVNSMEQFLILDMQLDDISRYGLVILDHYDFLIKASWDRDTRERAASALIQKATAISRTVSVVATSGCIKFQNEENCTLLAPATKDAKCDPGADVTRFMVYKDNDGNSVLSTGTKFRISATGLTSINPCEAETVPLHVLSSKRRLTPQRQRGPGPLLLTPSTQTSHKRRNSISTPSKRHMGGRWDPNGRWAPNCGADRPLHLASSQGSSSLTSSSPTSTPAPCSHSEYCTEPHKTSLMSSQPIPYVQSATSHFGTPSCIRASEPHTQANGPSVASSDPQRSFGDSEEVPNSQIEFTDPAYSI